MNRVGALVALLALLLGLPPILAQTADSPNIARQMANGRFWSMFSEEDKIVYVTAYKDSAVYSAVRTRDEREITDRWAAKAVVGDYITELDALYKDGENARLPIPMAIEYCTKKLRGNLTKDELEQILIGLRANVANW